MRNCIIVANWKLNNNLTMIKEFFKELKTNINTTNTKCHIAIAPSTIYLPLVKQLITNNNYPYISLAAQNVDTHLSGAFTGEISIHMLKEIGVQYIIIGHSERRKYHKENNKDIAKKFEIIKQTGLTPILCIGENQIEKNTGQTESVCIQQLNPLLTLLGATAFQNTIIAYEPIWAIGQGITETPDNIQNVHTFIRKHIATYNESIAKQLIIQYGGSVNPYNIQSLLIQPDIDGVLIGTNSLKAKTFSKIIQVAENTINKKQPKLSIS